MSTVLRLSSCLLVAAALAACNKSEPTAPAASADASAAKASAPVPQAQPASAPAADEAAPVALSMDKVKTYMQAEKNLALAEKADPAIGDSAQNESEENVAQYTARLQANAKMRAAIEAAGMSTSDFARTQDTLIGAMMANAALQGGQLKTLPEGIDPAAVEFVKQHKAEIDGLMGAAGAAGS